MIEQSAVEITSETLTHWIVDAMSNKKASNIVVLDLKEIKNAIVDYFVICSGSSNTQIDAISTEIMEHTHRLSKQGPWKKEGIENKEWVILDYIDVVVHVFLEDRRAFYGLEELWGDAKIKKC